MEAIGTMILSHLRPNEKEISHSESPKDVQSPPPMAECRQNTNQADKTEFAESLVKDVSSVPRRRVIGPKIPSSELLAAAAKLAQAEALLRIRLSNLLESDDSASYDPLCSQLLQALLGRCIYKEKICKGKNLSWDSTATSNAENVMKCPSCPTDISDFLQNPQVRTFILFFNMVIPHYKLCY
ncbi:hypothetical protein GIB67_029558 [Kingdonia uniflora]|uniref:Uncharacterized protein n=1 Tax=Kingdonia uniflora TaxID=39325 RepID=A0A7J7NYG9_9MAGN|nr:hypothetical protein GIB67_029558 [Kingdonia uniflora]